MGFELTTLVVIATDCTGSCKSNYYTITTAPILKGNKCLVYDKCLNFHNYLTNYLLTYIINKEAKNKNVNPRTPVKMRG